MLLSLFRSALFSERLAFLEILVPFLCCYFATQEKKKIHKFFPIIGICCIVFIFGLFEYSRSWLGFYAINYDGTFINFIIDRILGYYTVAINTECSFIEHAPCPFFPFQTMEWITKIPFIDLQKILDVHSSYGEIFTKYGNPEYNNPGGILAGVADFGYIGLIMSYWLGLLVGKFYKSYLSSSLLGYIYYPIFFLCILELPRYLYIGSVRFFYVFIGMWIISNSVRKQCIS